MIKKKVVLVGIHYPFAILSYFREALEFRDDVELATVGAYTGKWIPWDGGMDIPQRYVKEVTVPLPYPKTGVKPFNPKLVESRLPWKPDLWLNVDAGQHLTEKPTHGQLATVATDSHVLKYDHQRKTSDFFFNMHEHYSKSGDLILPYCYAPRIHKPIPDVDKVYDVCMIGLQYDQRNKLAQRLIEMGVNVRHSIGQVFDEYNLIFNLSRIGINWASMYDLNARFFELLAMKVPSVQWCVPDADRYFKKDIDYAGFTSIDEAVERVTWLLGNQETARQMAEQGYESVQGHTYDARIQQIFETVGLE